MSKKQKPTVGNQAKSKPELVRKEEIERSMDFYIKYVTLLAQGGEESNDPLKKSTLASFLDSPKICKEKINKATIGQTREEFQRSLEAKAEGIVSLHAQGVSTEVNDRLKKSILDFWENLPDPEARELGVRRMKLIEDILFNSANFKKEQVRRAKKYKADWERVFRNMLRAESGTFQYLDPVNKFIERKRQHVNMLLSVVQYGFVKQGDHYLRLPPGKKPQKAVSFQAKSLVVRIAAILKESGYRRCTQAAFDIAEDLGALPPHKKNEDKRVLLSRWRQEMKEIQTRDKQALELLKPFGA
jgi:hypothetical protein